MRKILRAAVVVFLALIVSCQQDETLPKTESLVTEPTKNGLRIEFVNINELKTQNPNIYQKIERDIIRTNQALTSRGDEYSNEYDFYYDSELVQVIEFERKTQYTLFVEREESQPNVYENYIYIDYESEEYEDKQFLATYQATLNSNGVIEYQSAEIIELNGTGLFGRESCVPELVPNYVDVCWETCCNGGSHPVGEECTGNGAVNTGGCFDCETRVVWINNRCPNGGGGSGNQTGGNQTNGGGGSSTSGNNNTNNNNSSSGNTNTCTDLHGCDTVVPNLPLLEKIQTIDALLNNSLVGEDYEYLNQQSEEFLDEIIALLENSDEFDTLDEVIRAVLTQQLNEALGEGNDVFINNLIDYLESINYQNQNNFTEDDYPGKQENFPYEWWLDENWLDDNFTLNIEEQQNQNPYTKLTKQEKELVKRFPTLANKMNENRSNAFSTTDNFFPRDEGHQHLNDKADAFRHAYFNALNTRSAIWAVLGNGAHVVKLFGEAHESEVPLNQQLEKQMDLHNNDEGILYCESYNGGCTIYTSDASIRNGIINFLSAGILMYLYPIDYSEIETIEFWDNPNTDIEGDGHHGILNSTQLIPTDQ